MLLGAYSGLIWNAYSQSDLFGKMIFLALFSLSLLCWIILLHKTYVIYSIRKLTPKYLQTIDKQKNNILDIKTSVIPQFIKKEVTNPFFFIYTHTKQSTLHFLKKNQYFQQTMHPSTMDTFLSKTDIESIDETIQTHIHQQTKKLEKNLFILSTIVSLAPFLGILGTVWGILISLFEMQSAGSAQSSSLILSGLSTALATTVLGLVIAIPALICYNYLQTAIKNLYVDMSHFGHDLLANIELQYRKVDI